MLFSEWAADNVQNSVCSLSFRIWKLLLKKRETPTFSKKTEALMKSTSESKRMVRFECLCVSLECFNCCLKENMNLIRFVSYWLWDVPLLAPNRLRSS